MDNKNTLTDALIAIYIVFLGGLLCFLAWNGWAWEFNLPQFSYWHWVATFAAIRFICGSIKKRE